MLRLTTHTSAAAAAHYFEGQHDYLADGEEKVATWQGKAAALLGLSGEVTPQQFLWVAQGRDPHTGELLIRAERDNRRVGTDFTWSAPKGVTLAYELTGDDRILAAFRSAVSETMTDIEDEVATRARAGGANETRVVGNAAWASFIHRTARPVNGIADPQMHIHAFLFSLVKDEIEDKWKSAEIGQVREDANYWEAVMLSRLSESMADLGYGVKRSGRYFELAGLDKPLLDKFSRRTQLIEKVAKDRNITNPDWKSELGGKTRERKSDGMSLVELKAEWVSRLTESDKAQLASLTDQQAELPTVEQSVRHALTHCFERSSINSARKVYETALRFGYGEATVEAVQQECQRQGLIVRDGQSTTKEALARERRLITWAREGRSSRPSIASAQPDGGLPGTLTPGQSTAIKHALTSSDRLILIQGQAGTGKTTLIKHVVAGIKLPHRAVAISTAATEELAEVSPNTATIARFLVDERMQEELRGGVLIVDEASLVGTVQMEQLTQVLDKVDGRMILVGDTSQHGAVQAGSPFKAVQMYAGLPVAKVSEIVRQAGLYKDAASRLAKGEIESGLYLLETAGWIHQADYTERMLAMATDYLWAVSNNMTVRAVAPTHEECDSVNRAIREQLQAAGKIGKEERVFSTLTPVSLTDAEKQDAVGLAQTEGLVAVFHRNKGKFKAGDRINITPDKAKEIAAASSAAAMFRETTITLAKGDVVRMTSNDKSKDGHKLTNGATYTVDGFTKSGVQFSNGWKADTPFLAPGYCATSHSAQGKTYDVVLVSMPVRSLPAVGSDTAYVALTRAKRHAYLFTDNLPELREAAKRDRTKSNASDLVEPSKEENRVKERATFMSRVKQIAAKTLTNVRQLTHRKEHDYGIGR